MIVKLQSLQVFVSSCCHDGHDDDNDDDDDQDKSSAKHNLDEFLKGAYAKQMKELNGTTGESEQSLCLCLAPCLLCLICLQHLCKNQQKYLFVFEPFHKPILFFGPVMLRFIMRPFNHFNSRIAVSS